MLQLEELELIDRYMQQGVNKMGKLWRQPDLWLAWWDSERLQGTRPRWKSLYFKKPYTAAAGSADFGPFTGTGNSIMHDAKSTLYSLFALTGLPDRVLTMLAWGQSETPGSQFEMSQRRLWETASFKWLPPAGDPQGATTLSY